MNQKRWKQMPNLPPPSFCNILLFPSVLKHTHKNKAKQALSPSHPPPLFFQPTTTIFNVELPRRNSSPPPSSPPS